MRTPSLALVALTAVLAACSQPTDNGGGNPGGNPGGVGGNAFTVSGNVVPGVALASAGGRISVQAAQQALAAIDWNARHAQGVLLVRADLGALRAQGVDAFAGLNAQSVGQNLTAVETGGQDERALAARLAAAGYLVQPDYVYRLASVVNDPGWPENSGIDIGGVNYVQDNLTRINVADAWAYIQANKPGAISGVKVAVLDTGINAQHPELKGHVLQGKDFCVTLKGDQCVGQDDDPSDAASNVHGTSTAGIIGASTNNGIGIAGVAWGAQILPVKVFGPNAAGATTTSLANGVNYAVQQGARVINMSLGFVNEPNGDPALSSAIASARANGSVVIASAGNTPNDGLYYPASDRNVIAVGATYLQNPDTAPTTESVACYSARPNPGQKNVDIYAPGGPGGTADVNGTVQACGNQAYNILSLGPNNGYQLLAGTSEAAPQVSGAASLMLAVNPGLTPDQVQSILTSTAKTFSGGKFLDVGAAVRRAAVTQGNGGGSGSNSYAVTVTANYQSGAQVGQAFSTTVTAGTGSIPYSLKLPAGSYTLNATITGAGTTQSGQRSVTVQGDTPNQNITTH